MNIHCSACGAPLPQGARFCPACALPLTPTVDFRRAVDYQTRSTFHNPEIPIGEDIAFEHLEQCKAAQ
jgi:predicted amidophosphoribosyltransferase